MRLQFYHNARQTVAAAQKRGLIKFPQKPKHIENAEILRDAKRIAALGIARGMVKQSQTI